MEWTEVCIHTTNEALEPISNILSESGISGLIVEDPLDLENNTTHFFGEIYEINMDKYPQDGIYIKAYLLSDETLELKVRKIKEAISSLKKLDIDIGKNNIILSEVKEEDWETAWKKYYKPLKITDNITIVPTWEEYHPDSNELIIELDPGMAFGTGTHPTTILSIRSLEKYTTKGDVVIDVGCGSGVLSIAAGLLQAKEIHAFDLDQVAVKSTALNVELNYLSDKVITKQNNLLKDVNLEADLIVSNILAEIIVKFVSDAWNNLKKDGYFITSGIIKKKKDSVVNELVTTGFEIIEINEMNDWISIVAKK